jgi:hypothetical protein
MSEGDEWVLRPLQPVFPGWFEGAACGPSADPDPGRAAVADDMSKRERGRAIAPSGLSRLRTPCPTEEGKSGFPGTGDRHLFDPAARALDADHCGAAGFIPGRPWGAVAARSAMGARRTPVPGNFAIASRHGDDDRGRPLHDRRCLSLAHGRLFRSA